MSSKKRAAELNDADETLQLEKLTAKYKWKIRNFRENVFDEPYYSCEKSLPMNIGTFKTYITYTKTYEHADVYVELYYNLNSSTMYKMLLEVEIFDSSGEDLYSEFDKFSPERFNHQNTTFTMMRRVGFNDVKDDILIIVTKVTQFYKNTTCKLEMIKKKPLSNDISALLESKDFSDVTIKVADKVYHAHQNILAARSNVFKTMLSVQMKEQKMKTIVIEEMTPEVFEELLFYIYNDRISDASNCSLELCDAANMYELLDLRELCENEIAKKISCENVLAILNYAHLANREHLKEQTVAFVVKNKNNLSKDDLMCLRKNESFVELFFKSYGF